MQQNTHQVMSTMNVYTPSFFTPATIVSIPSDSLPRALAAGDEQRHPLALAQFVPLNNSEHHPPSL